MLNQGYSGCMVEMERKYIVKTSPPTYPKKRLRRQAEKQELYKYLLKEKLYNIEIPIVFSISDENDITKVKFQYFGGPTLTDGIINNLIYDYKYYFSKLLNYIDWEIDKSVEYNFKNEMDEKFKELYLKTGIDPIPFRLSKEDTYTGLAGYCHGDLCFDNVICSNNKTVLIDFLDTYIDSPLQDIAKIRQDTYHYLTLYRKNSLNTDNIEKMKELDNIILDKYKHIIQTPLYKEIEQFTLWRIIPYCRNEEERDYLINRIQYV